MALPRTLPFGASAQVPVTPPNFQPMGQLLTYQAERDPNRPAVTIAGQTLSRAELDARTNRRARALAALGVGEGDYVTIGLPNGVEFHETSFALWKLGAIPAPVSYRLPAIELQAIVDLVNPKLVIGFDDSQVKGYPTLPAGFTPDAALSDAPMPVKIAPHWKAITSGGSTGRPKVILDQNPSVFDPDRPALGMQVDDVVLNPAPLYHNAPFGIAHMGLCWGAHIVEMVKFEAEGFLKLIEEHKVKWIYMVPTMMSRIAQLPAEVRDRYDVSSVEMVLHMAAACPVWLKEWWIEWLGADKIFELYAGTEVMGGTAITGSEWLAHKGSVGRIDPQRIKIVGEDGATLPAGEVGEIFFLPASGKGTTYRYIGAEAKAVGDWESYGDLGWLDEDGYLYLADRRTDLIISGGANIYPAEVEAALDAHPQVASAVVVGLPDDDLGHRVHAIIELRPGVAELDVGGLEAFAAERLARYKLPYSYEIARAPLRDDAGKVRRTALRDDAAARFKAGEVYPRLRAKAAVAEAVR